jgi:hypothetical protein
MPRYPALVIMGDDVLKDGFTSDTLCRRMPGGLHLGSGCDDVVRILVVVVLVVVVIIDDEVGMMDDVDGWGEDGRLPPPPPPVERDENMDDASLSIVPLSYNSSSQTSILRAISKIRDGPPDSVVRLGAPVDVVVVVGTTPRPSSSSSSRASSSPPPPIPGSSSTMSDTIIRPIPDRDFLLRLLPPLESIVNAVLPPPVPKWVVVPLPVMVLAPGYPVGCTRAYVVKIRDVVVVVIIMTAK